jgi:hypothetical protein
MPTSLTYPYRGNLAEKMQVACPLSVRTRPANNPVYFGWIPDMDKQGECGIHDRAWRIEVDYQALYLRSEFATTERSAGSFGRVTSTSPTRCLICLMHGRIIDLDGGMHRYISLDCRGCAFTVW